MPKINKSKDVGLAKWQVTPPRPAFFQAVVGDFTKYTVHLLTIERADESFLRDRFTEFLMTALYSAERHSRAQSCMVVFMFDTVYSILTITVSDENLSYEETNVFKLHIGPWDAEVTRGDPGDKVWEARTVATWNRLINLIKEILLIPAVFPVFERLRSRGFSFLIAQPEEERSNWKNLTTTGAKRRI